MSLDEMCEQANKWDAVVVYEPTPDNVFVGKDYGDWELSIGLVSPQDLSICYWPTEIYP